jgi:diguanylate cyclase (GGDEF)-like protein
VPADRRAVNSSTFSRPGLLRRAAAALRAGLYRPLAEDDDRAAYWVRHVRNGVVLTEIASFSAACYVVMAHEPGRPILGLLAMAVATMVLVPAILLLPLHAMMKDSRGPTLFYLWSVASALDIIVVTRLDGGSGSPLDGMLFLTLAFSAIAYSPFGVGAMGAFMIGAYFLLIELPDPTTSGLFFLSLLGSITVVCSLASANSWDAYDRQVMLIRAQETLASTDPLTGIPNRRAFIERATRAVNDAAWGHRNVVCLVDLDGFKGVNDTRGHAAGDAMLKAVAVALGGSVRETDTVARLGGDEFAVLADTSVGVAGDLLAERLRAAVAQVGGAAGVTASVGVADVEPGDDVEALMHRADAAMYRSKMAGGNRVTTLTY